MTAAQTMSFPPALRHGRALAGSGWALAGIGVLAGLALARRQIRQRSRPARPSVIHKLRQGAAIVGGSLLVDSAIEHFRGNYHNPAMYAAPIMGTVAVATSLDTPLASRCRTPEVIGHAASVAFGTAGLGFHLYNITKRPGRLNWLNLFYAAPIAAPGALIVAGTLNLGADALEFLWAGPGAPEAAQKLAGPRLGQCVGFFILANTAEVALLHFGGAFQNRAMYLPVTIPPLTALALIARSVRPAGDSRLARRMLWVTAMLGLIGTGFHIYGVGRNMGGWSNWRQNLLAGPPVPAPISFTGLALAGLAALDLMDANTGGAS